MNPKIKQTIAIIFVTAVAAFLLALTPMCAHAQPAAKQSLAGLMLQWDAANVPCEFDLKTNRQNAACDRRDQIGAALRSRGAREFPHAVWASAEQIDWYVAVVQHFNELARGKGVQATYELTPRFMGTLRAQLPDDVLFALWNSSHTAMCDTQPAAWALLSEAMPKLAKELSYQNDPGIALDY